MQPPIRIAAVIPVRSLESAKSRLGEALDAEERRGLVERLLRRAVEAAQSTPEIGAIAVVSADPAVRALAAELGAEALDEPGVGLNTALEAAVPWAIEAFADGLLVLPGDLPALTPRALAQVLGPAAIPGAMDAGLVVLAPDRAGRGTNALLVAPPGMIPFAFGEGSRAAHAAAAKEAHLRYVEVVGALALDLDTPDDLLAAEAEGLAPLLREPIT